MRTLFVLFAVLLLTTAAFPSLLVHYDFEGDLDDSVSSNDGTAYGNPTYTEGVLGQAISLDGSGDYITVPSAVLSSVSNQISISFWQYGSSSQPLADVIFEARQNTTVVMNVHLPWSDHNTYWDVRTDRVSIFLREFAWKNRWNHWVFIKNNSTGKQKIILNGMVIAQEIELSESLTGSTAVSIGAQVDGSYAYTGSIDDFRIYNHELSMGEVQTLYIAGKACNPYPADGTSYLSINASTSPLSWSEGDGATLSYNVYLGTNAGSVESATTASGEYKGNQGGTTYNPGALTEDTTYYWRIDEVLSGSVNKGHVWKFIYRIWDADEYAARGFESLVVNERDFRIDGSNGYYEDENHNAEAYVWPCSVQMMALAKAAITNPYMYDDRLGAFGLHLDDYWFCVSGSCRYHSGTSQAATPFYDDNAWVSVGFAEAYEATQDAGQLQRAENAYDFAISGEDTSGTPGGGIWWNINDSTRAMSSTAGTAWAAAKLYRITSEQGYLTDALRLLGWIENSMVDDDGIVLNQMETDGTIGTDKFSYNTAMVIDTYLVLYDATSTVSYLNSAKEYAEAARRFWLSPDTGAIMASTYFGFTLIECWGNLYELTGDFYWLGLVDAALNYLYEEARESDGTYHINLDGYPSWVSGDWNLLTAAPVAAAYYKAAMIEGTTIGLQDAIAAGDITATASTSWAGRPASNTSDGSGLTGFLHGASSTAEGMWHTTAGGTAWIKYAFDQVYTLGNMWVWNHNQAGFTSRGLRNVTIQYSTDNSNWSTLGEYEFPKAAGAAAYPHNFEIDFDGVSARYVLITAAVSEGNWGDTGPYYGLSEVRFGYTTGDPEPGITLTESDSSTDVSEAGPTSDTYTLVLDSEPDYNVVITVDPDTQTEINDNGAGTPVNFTFTSANWDSAQTVTVKAIDDPVKEGNHTSTITHSVSSSDSDYNNYSLSNVVADVTDNEHANLVAHWDFSDGSGSTLSDVAGGDYDATITGASWYGGSLDFDGSGDYISIPTNVLSTVDDEITVYLYVYGREQDSNFLLCAVDSSSNRLLGVHHPWWGRTYWDTAVSDRIDKAIAVGEYTGAWVKWVFTKNAGTGDQKIYRNGSLWHSGTGKTGEINGNTCTSFRVGTDNSGSYGFDGLITEIKIFDAELNSTEVSNL